MLKDFFNRKKYAELGVEKDKEKPLEGKKEENKKE